MKKCRPSARAPSAVIGGGGRETRNEPVEDEDVVIGSVTTDRHG